MASTPLRFPLRLAAIDIGSNALRFAAAEFTGPSDFHLLESQRVPVRLGQAAFRSRRLRSDRIEQTVAAMVAFRERLDALGVRLYRAVATSAVRESENGPDLIRRVQEEAGITLLPISGTEEGRLVWRALRDRLPPGNHRWLLADLGGGSLELSLVEGDALVWTESLALGTVRLLEELGGEGEEAEATLHHLVETSAASPGGPLPLAAAVEALIATGGNADLLGELSAVLPEEQGARTLTRTRVRELADQFAGLSVQERIEQLNLREDRADVIYPAALVYEQLARLAGTETIIVPGVGLKEGLLLDLMDELEAHTSREADLTQQLEEAALMLGRRYRFDEAHARQVAALTLHLYDALRDLHGLNDAERRILLAAALLHDVGKVVAKSRHHKHSRYLIRHAVLPGLTGPEVNLVALVARYHRGKRPGSSQRAFRKLEQAEQERVSKLAALLRVGDALDGDHSQTVRELGVVAAGQEVTLEVVSAGAPLDLGSLERRAKLFERVFERRLRVTRAGATAHG